MKTTSSVPKAKLRWLQFSLRGLLVLMVVVAVPLGWTMHKVNKVRQQRIAVAALEKMGCIFRYEDAQIGAATLPDWLRILLGENELWLNNLLDEITLRKVFEVRCGPQITDAGLVNLQGLNQFQFLSLMGQRLYRCRAGESRRSDTASVSLSLGRRLPMPGWCIFEN